MKNVLPSGILGQAKVIIIEQLEKLNVWHENFPQNKKQSIFQIVGVFWRISTNWRNFKQKTSIACFATGLIHSKGCILREVSYFGKKQTSEQNTRARARKTRRSEKKNNAGERTMDLVAVLRNLFPDYCTSNIWCADCFLHRPRGFRIALANRLAQWRREM